ncbi:DUF4249 domain-containing protein [Croceivirga thetidis]|uniref:DUF4249 domain-containing protein n=1 Tax=Croceivirga thetidis TaxID=2721623 RepID=A0ABX1GR96_9FLAO|nr:DUF4249 domain-containing protein [Croceivirga thetidis]NKI32473.1 DUF4249 domain-containing protein [Croceivirga thetidis]
MKKVLSNILFISLGLLLASCVEPFEIPEDTLTNSDLQDVLVVEANLTDIIEEQEVLLSKIRAFNFDAVQNSIQNATVRIIDGNGLEFLFEETESGKYVSQLKFAAVSNVNYQLQVQIGNKNYESTFQRLRNNSQIDSIYAERITTDEGQEGIGIFINSKVENGQLATFRYQFEETYKVIAPLWSPFDMVVLDRTPPYEFGLVPKQEEKRVCYGTQKSNEIILNEVGDVLTGNLNRFMVRFIPKDDFIISHRYSILVKQFAVNQASFSYYKTLEKQSTNENVFSGIQPGFIEGNIKNTQDIDELVIGFFDVSSESNKRLFFNYTDFFGDDELPPYAISCSFLGAPQEILPGGGSPLLDAIDSGDFVYVRDNVGQVESGGPFLTARRACGDCTALGSNQLPEFWTE